MNERIYILPPNVNHYKANLHCHSTVSDGKFTPMQLKEMYSEKGYSILACTDHQNCIPHNDLTDNNFLFLTGVEVAFGIKAKTSVHLCGISREPNLCVDILNNVNDDLDSINEGIRVLKEKNCITTLNHPRWSGISYDTLSKLSDFDNMEVANGFEMINDGYGNSAALYEMELRRGRIVRPFATDDSHRTKGGREGYEYFQGFTTVFAKELSYNAVIDALDNGNYYASTGPEFHALWLDGDILHVECSAVRGVYVHGSEYRHRGDVISRHDDITVADIKLEKYATSSYISVQLLTEKGEMAWSCPYYITGERGNI